MVYFSEDLINMLVGIEVLNFFNLGKWLGNMISKRWSSRPKKKKKTLEKRGEEMTDLSPVFLWFFVLHWQHTSISVSFIFKMSLKMIWSHSFKISFRRLIFAFSKDDITRSALCSLWWNMLSEFWSYSEEYWSTTCWHLPDNNIYLNADHSFSKSKIFFRLNSNRNYFRFYNFRLSLPQLYFIEVNWFWKFMLGSIFFLTRNLI